MLIRQFQEKDLNAVCEIERIAWGSEGAAKAEQILNRARICPEGSIVAEHLNGEVVGYAAAQRVARLSTASWDEVTDNGHLQRSHVANGPIAFGVGMSVLPSAARFGVSGAIIRTYAQTFVRDGGCHLLALGSRLPGFRRWRQQYGGSVQQYLDLQRKGFSVDPELCLYEKAGFRLMWPVAQYYPDPESENWGAIIAMGRRAALALA